MFNTQQFRDKAFEYFQRGKTATGPVEIQEFERLERSFTTLADNEQWLSDHHQNTVKASEQDRSSGIALPEEEERVLRCLGAALIMQWNTLPKGLRREIFDNAGSMGELSATPALRAQIARFLHKQNNSKGAEALDLDDQFR